MHSQCLPYYYGNISYVHLNINPPNASLCVKYYICVRNLLLLIVYAVAR